jgi:alpha-beta hydrolase superfamily lysophospholipase
MLCYSPTVRRFLVSWLISLMLAPLTRGQTTRNIKLTTADDIGIAAVYFPTEVASAPAVVLVHGLGQTRDAWTGLATLLQRNGIAALALDLRGHGESTRKITAQGLQVVNAQKFATQDYEEMLLDVNAAFDWLEEQPGIAKTRLAVIGSSLGANIALRYAALNGELRAVVLLSPGLVYRGLRTDEAIRKLPAKTALRVIVSYNDAFAFESSKRLVEMRHETVGTAAANTNELVTCTGNLHGTQMLESVAGLPQMIINWLKQTLLASEPAPVAPPTVK